MADLLYQSINHLLSDFIEKINILGALVMHLKSFLRLKSGLLSGAWVKMKSASKVIDLRLKQYSIRNNLSDSDLVPLLFFISILFMISAPIFCLFSFAYVNVGLFVLHVGFFVGLCAVVIGCFFLLFPVP